MACVQDGRFVIYSLVLCVTVAVCYLRALDCGFVFDDISAIVDNKDLRPWTPLSNLFFNDFWGTPMHMEKSHKSYRPLCVLTFRLNYLISELDPMSYHLLNVILHAVVCIMYMRMCSLFIPELYSFIAAMLFAVHPIHTEAVTGVVGRAESLSSIFFIAALMFYARCTGYHRKTTWMPLFTAIGMVSIAMLCKEQGITVIGVCVVYELFVAQRALFKDLWEIMIKILQGHTDIPRWLLDSIIRSVVLVGSTLFLLIARIKLMGAQLPIFTNFDNPASASAFPARQMTYNYLLPINFWLLLFPAELCCDWTMGTLPVLASILDPRNLVTVGFYLCFGKIVHFSLIKQGKVNRAIIMSLALMVMPFIPASNLFFPVGFVVAERILYTPSMGYCMLIAVGFDHIIQNKRILKPVLWCLMGCLVLFHVTKTYTRNIEWTSEYSVFRAALKVNHKNAKLWNNVGHSLEKENRYKEALEYFKKAASVQHDDIGALLNVGRTYKRLEMYAEAEEAFVKAKDLFPGVIPGRSYKARIAPSHLNIFLNLAELYARDPNRLEEASALLKMATDMRPDYIQGYVNRGDIFMKMRKHKDAVSVYEEALRYEPANADVLFNLGVVNMDMGNKPKAYQFFEEALSHDPEHWQSLYNSAVMIQEEQIKDKWPVAIDRLQQLMKSKKNDSRAPFSLAMLAMDMKDFDAAERYFKLALENEPSFKSALFNIGLLMTNDLNKPLEAVTYIRKLLEFYPDHSKGLMLLGELNVNSLKNLDEAEQSFTKVVDLEPGNIEAMHNLCVVYVERGDLLRAEKCLSHVHTLAPTQQYIVNHLNIVRAKINEYRVKQKTAEVQSKTVAKATGMDGQTDPLPIEHSLGQGQSRSGQGQTGAGQSSSDQEEATPSEEQTGHGETSDGSNKKDEA